MTGNVSSQRRAKEQDGLGGLLGGSGAVERDVRVRFRLVGVSLLAAGGDSEGDLYRSATTRRIESVGGESSRERKAKKEGETHSGR